MSSLYILFIHPSIYLSIGQSHFARKAYYFGAFSGAFVPVCVCLCVRARTCLLNKRQQRETHDTCS